MIAPRALFGLCFAQVLKWLLVCALIVCGIGACVEHSYRAVDKHMTIEAEKNRSYYSKGDQEHGEKTRSR